MNRSIINFAALLSIALLGCQLPGTGSRNSEVGHESVFVRKFKVFGYPPLARQARVQGTVSALVHIGSDGRVASVSNVNGPPLLIHAVVEALKSWEFALPNNKPAELRMTFDFSLRGKEARECYVTEVSGSLPSSIQIMTNPTQKPGPDWEYLPGRPSKN